MTFNEVDTGICWLKNVIFTEARGRGKDIVLGSMDPGIQQIEIHCLFY